MPSSPSTRAPVKFLCSHGGRILPRPVDGNLKYVGGETRVFSVYPDISFQDLMKKITFQIDEKMVLKYQIASEDLDSLVSVKSDEDAHHMFDEISRYEKQGISRLRTFLFPSNPIIMEDQASPLDPHLLEQRYIDAINGVIRVPPYTIKQNPTLNVIHHQVSSAGSSPRSIDSYTMEAMNNDASPSPTSARGAGQMFKVQSSPDISHQIGQSPKHLIVPRERFVSLKCGAGGRYQMDNSCSSPYYTSRHNRRNG